MERENFTGRLIVVLAASFLMLGMPGLGRSGTATAQMRETVKPVKIVQIYGRDTLEIGEIETFRVRVNAPYETAYNWKISDGAELGGNPIVYRFEKSGLYTLTAVAVNPTGKDTASLDVYVRPKKMPPPPPLAVTKPAASNENSGSEKTKSGGEKSGSTAAVKPPESSGAAGLKQKNMAKSPGGYTWVIATYFRRPPAEALANSYRAVGFRSSVIVDTGGKGSTVFRVTLGQFETEQKALEAKGEVLRNGVTNPLLHDLGGA